MVQVHHISKTYGIETVLDDISFTVSQGDRVGLVGPNGSGKSTLLRIIDGEEKPDAGHVSLAPNVVLGHLPQGFLLKMDQTVGKVVRSGIKGLEEVRSMMQQLSQQMTAARDEELDQIMERYGEVLSKFETLGGFEIEHRLEEILAGLGLQNIALNQPIEKLSGGQRSRIGLARLLITKPHILLLDEPTNHLDIQALEWLEDFLKNYHGAVLIVSHDRTFLNRTIKRVLALDGVTHKISEYHGNFSDYVAANNIERNKQWQEWRAQEAEIRRIKSDIHQTKMQAKSVELTTTSRQPSIRRYAKKVAKKAKSRERKLKRFIESEERVKKPEQTWYLKLDFEDTPRSGQKVLDLRKVGHRYQRGPWLFKNLDLTLTYGQRIALIGKNGSGKSTLLKIIAGKLKPVHGHVHLGAKVRIGYMPQEQEVDLDLLSNPFQTISEATTMNETEIRNFLHFFLFSGESVFLPIYRLSYGERARLILAKLVVMGTNFLVLDEPVNHLDIPSRERFEDALDFFPGTVLAAVHDRAFITRFAQEIWKLEAEKIDKMPLDTTYG